MIVQVAAGDHAAARHASGRIHSRLTSTRLKHTRGACVQDEDTRDLNRYARLGWPEYHVGGVASM